MFKKLSLDEIEKLVIPLRKDSYSGKSDYQRLELAGNNYRTIAALGAIQIFAYGNPFIGGHWRVAGTIFCLIGIVWFWLLGHKYRRACQVMEEVFPISLDDVRKKSEPTV